MHIIILTDINNFMEQNLDITKIQKFIDQTFDKSIIPELEAYIKIPCKSPLFDKTQLPFLLPNF